MPGERLQPSVIMTVTFVLIGAFLISTMPSLFNANAISQHGISTGYDTIGGINTVMWKTSPSMTAGTTYNLTGAKVQEYSNSTYAPGSASDWKWAMFNGPDFLIDDVVHVSFWDPSARVITDHRVDVWIVRNNTEIMDTVPHPSDPWDAWHLYRDFLFIREWAWSGAWFNIPTENYYAIIPFPVLTVHQQDGIGTTSFYAKFNLTVYGKYSTTSTSLIADMHSNHWLIGLGSAIGDSFTAKTSMWAMLGQLLTMTLPNVDPTVNFILAVPFWICITFVAVTIISRFIPFIGGG
jgi:hypothetical protein